MKVLKGFSEEMASCKWRKADIELDETDLLGICVANDIARESLTTGEAYAILSKEAEKLVIAEFVRAATATAPGAYDLDLLTQRFEAAKTAAHKQIEAVKARGSGS